MVEHIYIELLYRGIQGSERSCITWMLHGSSILCARFKARSSGFIGHDPLVDLRGRRFVLEGGHQVLPDRDELGDILSTSTSPEATYKA